MKRKKELSTASEPYLTYNEREAEILPQQFAARKDF
jgi:hypothetical protein